MNKKQTKTTQMNQEIPKLTLKNKLFMVLVILLALIGAGFTVQKINKKLEVDTINNYVCEIVHSDADAGILAMRCMAKQAE